MKKKISPLFYLLLLFLSVAAIWTFTNNFFTKNTEQLNKHKTVKKTSRSLELLYGINPRNFFVETGHIAPNMYLSNLFARYKLQSKLSEALKKSQGIFEAKKIKRGQKYTVFLEKDTARSVQYLVYEKNKTDYVVFDFRDTLKVYPGKKRTTIRRCKAELEIQSSLWASFQKAGLDPLLANKLSDIYAWSVDFFGLQKQDNFKVIFEKKYVDTTCIGYGKLIAAYFARGNDTIYAIPFNQDSTLSFFDAKGHSLKRAFLKAPLKYSRISSGFSYARKHPILKIVRPHLGVDYAAPSGTPVYALGDGKIIHAAYSGGAGNYIKIKHNSVYTTGYMHLKAYAKGIKSGMQVKQGQLIGYVGSTGISTGPHLDFRVWKNGKNINPLHLKSPSTAPVKDENKDRFAKVKRNYIKILTESRI